MEAGLQVPSSINSSAVAAAAFVMLGRRGVGVGTHVHWQLVLAADQPAGTVWSLCSPRAGHAGVPSCSVSTRAVGFRRSVTPDEIDPVATIHCISSQHHATLPTRLFSPALQKPLVLYYT